MSNLELFPTLLNLPPKIPHVIFRFLSQHDLIQFVRASRHVNTVCTPLLWSTIHLKTEKQLQRVKAPVVLPALARNHSYIREFTITTTCPANSSNYRQHSATKILFLAAIEDHGEISAMTPLTLVLSSPRSARYLLYYSTINSRIVKTLFGNLHE
ncbi:MAG: hypothetical protein BYD32DRAFT_456453 [Podila humilis]|nr:MAG: hypothetical protein BYD32DRAFT_456453 [Podila humilis]